MTAPKPTSDDESKANSKGAHGAVYDGGEMAPLAGGLFFDVDHSCRAALFVSQPCRPRRGYSSPYVDGADFVASNGVAIGRAAHKPAAFAPVARATLDKARRASVAFSALCADLLASGTWDLDGLCFASRAPVFQWL